MFLSVFMLQWFFMMLSLHNKEIILYVTRGKVLSFVSNVCSLCWQKHCLNSLWQRDLEKLRCRKLFPCWTILTPITVWCHLSKAPPNLSTPALPTESLSLLRDINTLLQNKAKCAAYIPPHSASSTLWAVYKLIMQATHCPPSKLGTHFTDLRRIEGWVGYWDWTQVLSTVLAAVQWLNHCAMTQSVQLRAVVLNFRSLDFFGLQLPKILASKSVGEGFWEF